MTRKSSLSPDHVSSSPSKPRLSVPPQTDRLGSERPEQVLEEVLEDLRAKYRDEKTLAERKREVTEIIRRAPGVDLAEKINRALFKLWAPTYDMHMAGHEISIHFLLKMIKAVSPLLKYRIPKGNILEMSCGTGAIIDMLCRTFPPEEVGEMRIVANDISSAMQKKAHKKLEGLPNDIMPESIDFEWNDIRETKWLTQAAREEESGIQHIENLIVPRDPFDTAILAQTLHLITDPQILEEEEGGDYSAEGKHIGIKMQVLRNAFEALRADGHLLIIDEWPEVLSDDTDPLLAELFRRLMRSIPRNELREHMSHIPGARFVCELKANIDHKHSMYLLLYRKDMDKIHHRREYSRDPERKIWAAEKVKEALVRTDKFFIQSCNPLPSGWTRLKPLSEVEQTVITKPTFDFEPSDMVVLERVFHNMPDNLREDMIRRAVESVNMGGAILFLDEWHPTDCTNRLSRTYLRNHLAQKFEKDLIFQASYREPVDSGFDNGMTGFLFRKKSSRVSQ